MQSRTLQSMLLQSILFTTNWQGYRDKIVEVLKLIGWRVASWIGAGAGIAALLIPSWQIYTWLQTGHWPNVTAADLIVPLTQGTDFGTWLSVPQSWYGLQKVFRFFIFDLPLWVWMVAVFYIGLVSGAEVLPANDRSRPT